MLWPKKNSYQEFDNEKNSRESKITHPHPIPPVPYNPAILRITQYDTTRINY